MKVPLAEGVPLIVIVLLVQDAVTPDGNPVGVPIPVAPVVVCVMLVNAVFEHTVGEDEAAPTDKAVALLNTKSRAVFLSELDTVTVIFPVAPLETHEFQAAPTDASSSFVVTLSKSSV